MANRRFGGGNTRSGRSFPQQFQSSSVSPWQGGAAPNNSLNSGLLSQLAAPQAQLALALTSLLQNQQQPNNPPSLLSLNTSPAFGNQDNYGSQNRFASRGRDFRRPEPYNKNRSLGAGNWRLEARGKGSSNRNDFRSNKDKKSPLKKSSNKPKDSDKNEKVDSDSSNKQSEDVIDVTMDENRDEDGGEKEKKRDWKEEKKAIGDQEKDDSGEVGDETSGDDDNKKEQGLKRPKEGRYQGIPPSLLHCFVCTKSMWDGESFQNHLRGKAHKQMMDSLIESFQITVNILRENMRLAEEKKMIEWERFNRSNRSFHRKIQEPESHCNMCDLKFLGKIISHRKTEGHQRLKRFLHPSCNHCKLEFPSRVEWVEHRFTKEHLKKLTEMKPGESAKIIEDDLEVDLEPLLEETLLSEDENPVLELDDDLKDLQNRIPAYKRTRIIGKGCLKPVTGHFCDICDRFVHDKDTEAHLRSERHYYRFIDAVKTKYKAQTETKDSEKEGSHKRRKLDGENKGEAEEKTAEEESAEDSALNGDGNEMYDPEEACKENNAADEAGDAKLEEEEEEILEDKTKNEKNEEEEEEQEEKKASEKPSVKEEPKEPEIKQEEKKVDNSPKGRRSAAGGGQVKNGAGPKSKTRGGRKN